MEADVEIRPVKETDLESLKDAINSVCDKKWYVAITTLMTLRGAVASALGLKHEDNGDFHDPLGCRRGARYQIGQRVGLFSVKSIEPNELIVGEDDKHLDFRISIYRSTMNNVEMVTVSTAVEIHNTVGMLYMLVVKPFHRVIAKSMVQRAANAGRL